MAENRESQQEKPLIEIFKERLVGLQGALGKIDVDGEGLLKGVTVLAERVVPEVKNINFESLAAQAFSMLNQAAGENRKQVLDRLNLPSKKEMDEYNKILKTMIEEAVRSSLERLTVPTGKDLDVLGKQLRINLDEQMKKGLTRLNIATRKDIQSLSREIKKLQKEVAALKGAKKKPAAKAAPKKQPAKAAAKPKKRSRKQTLPRKRAPKAK